MQTKLAIHGGEKAIAALPARFHFGAEEKAAVDALFDKAIETGHAPGYNGPEEEAFCREFADFMGAAYADGTNGGTNSVYVSLLALQLPAFSEVVVGCMTDPGGIMPVVICNCIPIPADTMPGSYNTGAAQIEARITKRTSAILVAHLGGEPADMPAICKVAEKYGLPIVEDCAQSHLAKINGRNVGTFGRYGAFSLMFGKHMCTGGQGGAVICNNETDYWNERRAADRGKPFGLPAGSTNCLAALSCNMDEFHATVGRVQLKKLLWIVEKRRNFVKLMIERGFDRLQGISIPTLPAGFMHCYWWWRLAFNAEKMTCTKEEYCNALTAEGISVNPSYGGALPTKMDWYLNRVTRHPWNNPLYTGCPDAEYPIPNAEKAVADHFNFNFFESYGKREADQIFQAFKKVDDFYRK